MTLVSLMSLRASNTLLQNIAENEWLALICLNDVSSPWRPMFDQTAQLPQAVEAHRSQAPGRRAQVPRPSTTLVVGKTRGQGPSNLWYAMADYFQIFLLSIAFSPSLAHKYPMVMKRCLLTVLFCRDFLGVDIHVLYHQALSFQAFKIPMPNMSKHQITPVAQETQAQKIERPWQQHPVDSKQAKTRQSASQSTRHIYNLLGKLNIKASQKENPGVLTRLPTIYPAGHFRQFGRTGFARQKPNQASLLHLRLHRWWILIGDVPEAGRLKICCQIVPLPGTSQFHNAVKKGRSMIYEQVNVFNVFHLCHIIICGVFTFSNNSSYT